MLPFGVPLSPNHTTLNEGTVVHRLALWKHTFSQSTLFVNDRNGIHKGALWKRTFSPKQVVNEGMEPINSPYGVTLLLKEQRL